MSQRLRQIEARIESLEQVMQQLIDAMNKQNATLGGIQMQLLEQADVPEEPLIVIPN